MLLFVFIHRTTGLLQPGYVPLLLSHITFCIPYVVLQVMPRLRQANPHLYEAALDDGTIALELPQEWEPVVRRMLKAHPETRPSDAEITALFAADRTQKSKTLLRNGLNRLMKT